MSDKRSDFITQVQKDSLNQVGSEVGHQNAENTRLGQNSRSRIYSCLVVAAAIAFAIIAMSFLMSYAVKLDSSDKKRLSKSLPKEQAYWFDKGVEELKFALKVSKNENIAKNVILFIGDGMGPNTVTATRIYKNGEEGLLSWEKFPYMGLLKTYNMNKQVPDSMSTGTAMFSGIKVNHKTGGVDSTVSANNCTASLDPATHIENILQWAQQVGMRTGIVTTTRITHATPAALYSHVANRYWECDAMVPQNVKEEGCKDIARVLIEDLPGRAINVIMGGGRQYLVSNVTGTDSDPIDVDSLNTCYSIDGRNLISTWEEEKKSKNARYAVISNNEELASLDAPNTDYVLGIFSNSHIKCDYNRDTGPKGMPSLKDMTVKALEVLKNKNSGFLLVVEGGNIDLAHHNGTARVALSETAALDEAVNATLENMKDEMDETLIIVTADHSHTLAINGYADRGANIFSVTGNIPDIETPYTTLTYGTSKNGFEMEIDPLTKEAKRRDPTLDDTTSYEYKQQGAVKTAENQHGGSDVTVYAIGPMAHLFHKVHEQNYVAHVMSYALRVGLFNDSTLVESLSHL